jgi:hypothetical protein
MARIVAEIARLRSPPGADCCLVREAGASAGSLQDLWHMHENGPGKGLRAGRSAILSIIRYKIRLKKNAKRIYYMVWLIKN